MSQKKSIYLAHPISLNSTDDVFAYYDNMTRNLHENYGFTVLSPMYGKDFLRTEKSLRAEGYHNNPTTSNHAIFERDTWMVSQADIVFCDFTGSTVTSIGCCMELAIASWLRKHTIVVIPDDNIHNHSFVREAADVVFTNTEDALDYLACLK